MSSDFPDTYEAKSPPQWATLVPTRRPEFKVHTSLGTAHSAIADKKPSREVALYHLEVGEGGTPVWKKSWEYKIPDVCSECGKEGRHYYIPYRHEGRIKDAPVVCEDCHHRQSNEYLKLQIEQRERESFERLRQKYGE